MGIRAFIFSGYPNLEEAEHFGCLVMPELTTLFSLPHVYGKVPEGQRPRHALLEPGSPAG